MHDDDGSNEEGGWRQLWDDPSAAAALIAELRRSPRALEEFVAHVAELRQEHEELGMLHEATLEHANEIEDQLAIKVDEASTCTATSPSLRIAMTNL